MPKTNPTTMDDLKELETFADTVLVDNVENLNINKRIKPPPPLTFPPQLFSLKGYCSKLTVLFSLLLEAGSSLGSAIKLYQGNI